MNKLLISWNNLMSLTATPIKLLQFSEGDYDEKWDEGTKLYDEYSIPARVKYEISEREITDLGEDLKLDALLIVRQTDLTELKLEISSKDHFKIDDKEYRITRIKPVTVASEKVGFKIGIIEIL